MQKHLHVESFKACQAPADPVEVARQRLQRLCGPVQQIAMVIEQLVQGVLASTRTVTCCLILCKYSANKISERMLSCKPAAA